MPALRQFRITIDTPDGRLGPAEVAVPEGPLRLADLAPPVHALTDGVVDLAVRRAAREGRALSCGPGCGVCCRQLVPLAPAEALYLVECVLAMPLTQRASVLERFEENERRLIETGLLDRVRNLDTTEDNDTVARDYFGLGIFCPFCTDLSCSIHAVRPIACREYNVTSLPALCTDPFSNTIATVKLHRRLSAGFTKFCAHTAGLPAGLVPMPLMLDYFEEHRTIGERTWPGVELFKQAMGFVLGGGNNRHKRGEPELL